MSNNQIDSRLIGQAIKALRVRSNLTQSELAEDIGYSIRNLRRIETGGTTSIEVVNTFAEYFDVPALDILNGCLLFYYLAMQIKKHRPSPYNAYPNLLFTHVHARLSDRLRSFRFWNGSLHRDNGRSSIILQPSASFSYKNLNSSWPSPNGTYQISYRWLPTIKPNTSFDNVDAGLSVRPSSRGMHFCRASSRACSGSRLHRRARCATSQSGISIP